MIKPEETSFTSSRKQFGLRAQGQEIGAFGF